MSMNFKVSILPTADNTYSLGSASSRWQLNGALPPTFDTIYPVGSIYMSINNTNPSTLFGGTWEQITGKFLLACDTTYTAGTTGGSSTVTLETANLPSHTHSIGAHAHGLNSHTHTGPSHTHTGPSHTHGLNGHTHTGPSHTHTRGTMNITGTFKVDPHYGYNRISETSGAFYSDTSGARSSGGSMESDNVNVRAVFDASRNWSGSTSASGTGSTGGNSGNTTAAGTGATGASGTGNTGAATGNTANSTAFDSGSTGSGTAINNMSPYLAVYIWKRTA